MSDTIIDLGRGPQIAGTRITVYDIMDYHRVGCDHASIAVFLGLSSADVRAAIAYIEEHKEEVSAVYEEILDRSRQGNTPEVRAKLKASRAKVRAMLKELKERKGKDGHHAEHPGRS